MLARFVGAILIATAAASAFAEGYLGLSVGQVSYKDACPSGITCDTTDTGFKLFGGYQLTPNLAFEAGYSVLGTIGASSGEHADLSAFEVSGVGSWPLGNRFALLGRLGLYYGAMEAPAVSAPVTPVFPPPPPRPSVGWKDGNTTSVTFGLGASYEMTHNATLRLEWQRFKDLGGEDGTKVNVDVFSLGLVHRF
jgi:OOP family OmpA-OmpF porin